MSIAALAWAWSHHLDIYEKMTLLALADCHNSATARCDPSVRFIAQRGGMSERRAQISLRALEEKGLVEAMLRRPKTSYYRLRLDRVAEPAQDEFDGAPHAPSDGGDDAQRAPGEVHGVRLDGAQRAPKPRKNLKREPIYPSPDGDADFDEWYQGYPRKVGKDAAKRAYRSALKRGATPTELLRGLRRHTFSDDLKFVPHPATWLNQGRWADEPSDASGRPKPGQQSDMWGVG